MPHTLFLERVRAEGAGMRSTSSAWDSAEISRSVSRLQALLDRHALGIELQATKTACQYRAAGQVRVLTHTEKADGLTHVAQSDRPKPCESSLFLLGP